MTPTRIRSLAPAARAAPAAVRAETVKVLLEALLIMFTSLVKSLDRQCSNQ